MCRKMRQECRKVQKEESLALRGEKGVGGGERRVKTNIGTFPPADSGSFCKAVGGGEGG